MKKNESPYLDEGLIPPEAYKHRFFKEQVLNKVINGIYSRKEANDLIRQSLNYNISNSRLTRSQFLRKLSQLDN